VSLSPGTRIGHYEILSLIGKGGMGEVFRARDRDLDREVAIKVLPEAFARDPERLARFEREARLLASLNHPHIATLHGLERSGEVRFLVMELVPGETLADALSRRPFALSEALDIFRQVAEALEAAHDRGVVHRDLKPANVKVTPDGKVKVLDFGLAKALSTDSRTAAESSESPTRGLDPTEAGVILGTAPYMSPEQVRGKAVDRRTDVWAFGCVFFQALTGRKPFSGETFSDTAAAILGREPDWALLPGSTPLRVRQLLRRTLQKDPNRRLRDMGDVRLEIEDSLSAPTAEEAPRRSAPSWIVGALGLTVGAFFTARSLVRSDRSPLEMPIRFAIEAPSGMMLAMGPRFQQLSLSPRGTHLVFAARRSDGRTEIQLRALDRIEMTGVAGTEGGFSPFFSPDGRWLGFFTDFKLKKVSLDGGSPITLCDVPPVTRGGSWGPDDDAIVLSLGSSYGLFRVPAGGGVPSEFARTDPAKSHFGYLWPQVLPGGKAVLFTIWTGTSFDEAKIALLRLPSGEPRVLVDSGSYGRYVPSGHIVFARSGSLLAVPFDLSRLQVVGSPVAVLDGLMTSPSTGAAFFDVSENGTLAYVPATNWADRTLVWTDREGKVVPASSPSSKRAFENPRLSPDGRRLAVQVVNDIWIYELERDTLRRITFEGINQFPVWSPDGKRVVYSMAKTGEPQLYSRSADGSGGATRLTDQAHVEFPNSWSPDGAVLAYARISGPQDDWDVFVATVEGKSEPLPLLRDPFNETQPMFSADGRWLAYVSNESGRHEVYVRAYPGLGAKWQISSDGGAEPLWAPNGNEVFFRHGEEIMAVSVEGGADLRPGKPRLLFKTVSRSSMFQPGFTSYDITRDGRRFLMTGYDDPAQAPRQIHLTLHWLNELKRALTSSN